MSSCTFYRGKCLFLNGKEDGCKSCPIVKAYKKGKREAEARFKEDRTTGKWISVKDRLPYDNDYRKCYENYDGTVLYCTDKGVIGLGWYYTSTRCWANLHDEAPDGVVIAWQPLPEPYKEAENEQ